MKTPVSSELLDKYLSGTCTPQEQEEVENWYQSYENSTEISTLYPDSENEEYSQSVFEKIKSRIKIRETEDKTRWKLPISRQAFWYLAASVLIGIGVSFLSEKNHFPVKSKTTLAGDPAASPNRNSRKFIAGLNAVNFSALILSV